MFNLLKTTTIKPIPPREGFRPAGTVRAARFCTPTFIKKRAYTGVRAQGIRYERAVLAYLRQAYADLIRISPWITFLSEGSDTWRWCQPDALLIEEEKKTITIIEIKLRHTADAWWQIRKLYQPVVEHLYPPAEGWLYQVAEIVNWFEPIPFPEEVKPVPDFTIKSNHFKVQIWKP